MPKIGLIQMASSSIREDNLLKAEQLTRIAVGKGAKIICYPELFHDFFFMINLDNKYFSLAEPVPGPITETMCKLALELEVVIVVPTFEKVGRSVYYNTAVVIDADGKILGKYRKNHIPLSTIFYEKLYFKPGNLGYPVFKTRYGNLGILICHDRHYPEAVRCLALSGAELLLIPTATPSSSLSVKVWEKELMGHAIANQLYIAAVNRIGTEKQMTYYGKSLVIDPVGEILGQAGSDEEILLVDIDYDEIDRRRIAWAFYRERRPETYQKLIEFIP